MDYHKLIHPEAGKSGLSYDYFGKTDSRPIYIDDQDLHLVFVGSPHEDDNGVISGKVHIYGIDGSYKTTISSSDPSFGTSVFSIKRSNRLLVGAPNEDKAYLYDVDNDYTLLNTFQADTSGEKFGWAVIGIYFSTCYSTDGGITTTNIDVEKYFIGAPDGNKIYVFNHQFNQDAALVPPVFVNTFHKNPDPYDQAEIFKFGYSIIINEDWDDNNPERGIFRVFLNVGAPDSYNGNGVIFRIDDYVGGLTNGATPAWTWYMYQPDPLDFQMVEPLHVGRSIAVSNYECIATVNSDTPAQTTTTNAMAISSPDFYRLFDSAGTATYTSTNTIIWSDIKAITQGRGKYLYSAHDGTYRTAAIRKWEWNGFSQSFTYKYAYSTYSLYYVNRVLFDDANDYVLALSSNIRLWIWWDAGSYFSIRASNFLIRPDATHTKALQMELHPDPAEPIAYVAWECNKVTRLQWIDYSNPYSPTFGFIGDTTAGNCYKVKVDKSTNILYTLERIDPLVDEYGFIINPDASNDFLVPFEFEIRAYDIETDPKNPILLSSSSTYDWRIYLQFLFAYPKISRFIWKGEYTLAIDEVRKRLYFTWNPANTADPNDPLYFEHTWLIAIDISDPYNLELLGWYDFVTSGTLEDYGYLADDVAYLDNKVWVSILSKGVAVLDGEYVTSIVSSWDTDAQKGLSEHILNPLSISETTYGDAIWNLDDLIFSYNATTYPTNYPTLPWAKSVDTNKDAGYYQSDKKAYYVGAPQTPADNSGTIDWESDTQETGVITDPFGITAGAETGYSIATSEAFVAYNSNDYVVVQPHVGYNIFKTFDRCDPTCALIRLYDSTSLTVNMVQELVAQKGISGIYNNTFDASDYMIVVHHKGKIQIRGKHLFYIDDYNPPTPPANPTHKINYTVYEDGIPVARKVSLFDKLTGQFEQFADSDPNNPENNVFLLEDGNLKFLIAFDPNEIMDPVGIDDILPEPYGV